MKRKGLELRETVLVTGGAGFIGRAVTKELLGRGATVRVLDNLIEQVHGDRERPDDFPKDAELIVGDIRNRDVVARALYRVDSVVHLAAEVGVGQSMYAVERYTSVNETGSAVLFEALIDHPVRRVVTASSMSIYGEGLYEDADGDRVQDATRDPQLIAQKRWDPLDDDGRPLKPVATPEWKQPSLASVYALGKYVQERQTFIMTQAYGMEGTCLRLFNVYGPGQALSNPYTGVLAIFSSRLSNGQRPLIFEDGEQRRDFVHVGDVARAFADTLVHPRADAQVFNIGSGVDRSVTDVARSIARALGRDDIEPEITGKARVGDIRHCFCDGSKAADVLGFRAQKNFDEGLAELAEWVGGQTADDHVDEARAELEIRGLVA
jgi:dTDP-L-rhamnose 4-epimerase